MAGTRNAEVRTVRGDRVEPGVGVEATEVEAAHPHLLRVEHERQAGEREHRRAVDPRRARPRAARRSG